MEQNTFAIEALKLLGEINDFNDYYQVHCVENYFNQYKALLSSSRTSIPGRALSNLPFIAMSVQMAKIKNQPESKKRHAKRTCKWLKADLELLLNSNSVGMQMA